MKTSYSGSLFYRLLSALIFSSVPLIVLSQETGTCAENLKAAQSLFNQGQVEKVPGILRECMKSGFKREEQLAAYKLLIQSYLFEDKLGQADSAMLEFLKKNPEYQLSPTDHSSFVFLYKSFKVKPVVQIIFHIGTNLPFITSINTVTTSPEPGKNSYSSSALNLFTSLEAKFEIKDKLDLNIEGGYSQSAFSNVEEVPGLGKINYTETQQRIELPLSVTYNIAEIGKFTPYIRAGAGAAFNLALTAKVSVTPTDPNNFESHSGPDINRKESRIFMDLFAHTGVGVKFKIPHGYINLEIRSNFGLLNQTINSGSPGETPGLDYETLRWDYNFVDDDFNLNNLNFNIGYTYIFYKPSKSK
jgi:hypothetical protein